MRKSFAEYEEKTPEYPVKINPVAFFAPINTSEEYDGL